LTTLASADPDISLPAAKF